MRTLRILVVWMLVAGLGTPAFAGELRARLDGERSPGPRARASAPAGSLRESVASAAEEQAQSGGRSMPKAYLWAGSALFVGGMAVGLYGFLNNKNGSFPEFNEADATDRHLGTAGLAVAFVGGTILFIGERRAHAPAVTFGPGRVAVSKQLSW